MAVADNVYLNLKTSLLKLCKDIGSDYSLGTLKIIDFDSYGSMHELPPEDLIGIGEYSVDNMGELYVITCSIGVCTSSKDSGLVNLNKIINAVFSRLKPGVSNIPVVNPGGAELGNLYVMEPVRVLPVTRANNRPYQLVSVSFGVTFHTPPII